MVLAASFSEKNHQFLKKLPYLQFLKATFIIIFWGSEMDQIIWEKYWQLHPAWYMSVVIFLLQIYSLFSENALKMEDFTDF